MLFGIDQDRMEAWLEATREQRGVPLLRLGQGAYTRDYYGKESGNMELTIHGSDGSRVHADGAADTIWIEARDKCGVVVTFFLTRDQAYEIGNDLLRLVNRQEGGRPSGD